MLHPSTCRCPTYFLTSACQIPPHLSTPAPPPAATHSTLHTHSPTHTHPHTHTHTCSPLHPHTPASLPPLQGPDGQVLPGPHHRRRQLWRGAGGGGGGHGAALRRQDRQQGAQARPPHTTVSRRGVMGEGEGCWVDSARSLFQPATSGSCGELVGFFPPTHIVCVMHACCCYRPHTQLSGAFPTCSPPKPNPPPSVTLPHNPHTPSPHTPTTGTS